jgi:lipopolysaccharide biosynthesis regulator YciM
MILWWANLDGAKAVPGSYQVHLNSQGETLTQSFKIIPDPRAEASASEMQQQYDFISDVNGTVDRAHQSIKKIRGVNTQLDAFINQYKGNEATADLVARAEEMKEGFGEIEKALYQTQNRSGQDPLNFPIRLTNKLAHLNSLVSLDDFPPTAQDVAVKNELSSEINKQLNAFDKMVDEEISSFNKAFNDLNLNYLFVEE